jgi:hypothetical protein
MERKHKKGIQRGTKNIGVIDSIDHGLRIEDRKKVGVVLSGYVGAIRKVETLSQEERRSSPPRN